jgi:fructokinase
MNASPTHFYVAGEALIDMIEQADGSFSPKLGGSPWNVARALGRQGCRVTYCNPLSTDDFGHQLASELQRSNVHLMGQRSAFPTSLALVKLDADGQPNYAFYRESVADRDLNPMVLLNTLPEVNSVFHVGSLALLPPDGVVWGQLLDRLLDQGRVTSIDINMRPMVAQDRTAYASLARDLLSKGCVIKVSDEDLKAMQLLGDPLNEARALLTQNTQIVVLTLGKHGAWCLTQNSEIFQSPAHVQVVDSVGAGDCFYAGFLLKLADLGGFNRHPFIPASDDTLKSAMAFGNQMTAWNLQKAGCQPPWKHEL